MATAISILNDLIKSFSIKRFKPYDASQDYEQVFRGLATKDNDQPISSPFSMTVIGNYLYLVYQLSKYTITRIDFNDPSKETTIYQTSGERLGSRIKSFTILGKSTNDKGIFY